MMLSARLSVGLVFALLGFSACAKDSVAGPEELTLDGLHTAAVDAGLGCDSMTDMDFPESEEDGFVDMGGCGTYPDTTLLMIYSGHDSALAASKEGSGPPQLLGSNWLIVGDSAVDLAETMGEALVPAKDGYDEARACEEQVEVMLRAWVAGVQDDAESIAAMQEANETGSPAVTIAPDVMSKVVAPNVPSVGADVALLMGMNAVAADCRRHYISGYFPDGRDAGPASEIPTTRDEPEPLDDNDAEPNATESASCEATPDFTDDSLGCLSASALLRECENLTTPLTVPAWGRVGITEWESAQGEQESVAVTSQDTSTYEPTLLSCGSPTNGVDVVSAYDDVWSSAEEGWGIEPIAVHCQMRDAGLLDTSAPGQSRAVCEVSVADGAPGYAYVSVTDSAPYYRIDLGE